MDEVQIRSMTVEEFGAFRERSISEYAAEHVRAGDWSPNRAEGLAARQTDELLPDGLGTAGMLFLVAETRTDGVVGMVWVALEREGRVGAWIYAIEVVPEQRGRGYGRALLRAAEGEVERNGGTSVGLNLFGGNVVARRLYESSGYDITWLDMRKGLTPESG
jgi:ribosomal protein S18 acetylase RimI-like enzyme